MLNTHLLPLPIEEEIDMAKANLIQKLQRGHIIRRHPSGTCASAPKTTGIERACISTKIDRPGFISGIFFCNPTC